MYAKDLYGNVLTSEGYRAELTTRMTRKPPTRRHVPPQYAKIQDDTRSHKCGECDKLHYEIERLQMQLEEKSSRGTRLAMIDTKESSRSTNYRHNTDWEASWASTPDMLSTHNKGDNPGQRRQKKNMEDEIKRLKRELHQKSMEVRMLRESRTVSATRTNLPKDDALVDPLPVDRVATLYNDIYQDDWTRANKALLKDKLTQQQSANKLISILTAAFAYCDRVAPEHLNAILKSTIKVKPQSSTNVPNLPNQEVEIHQEAVLFRKSIAEKVVLNVVKNFRFEVFMKMSTFSPQQKQNYDITSYVDKCVHITWYMAVQNYPIILDDSVIRDTTFEYEYYSSFEEESEVEGAVYDYLIWPALINEENNTFICKGVAKRLLANV